jgi:hypothetical protein
MIRRNFFDWQSKKVRTGEFIYWYILLFLAPQKSFFKKTMACKTIKRNKRINLHQKVPTPDKKCKLTKGNIKETQLLMGTQKKEIKYPKSNDYLFIMLVCMWGCCKWWWGSVAFTEFVVPDKSTSVQIIFSSCQSDQKVEENPGRFLSKKSFRKSAKVGSPWLVFFLLNISTRNSK